MKTLLRAFAIAAVLIAVALPARPSEAAPEWRATVKSAQRKAAAALTHAFERIQATPKQRTAIRRILARSAAEAWALRGEALQLQDQIAAAVLAAETDDAELDQLEKKGIKLLGRGAHLTRTGLTDAAAVLSAEQRAELLAMWRRWIQLAAGS